MSVTKRDRLIVNILDNHIKCITTQQVNMLPCFCKDITVASRRLKKLKDYGYLQRQMYEVIGNSYVYYSNYLKYPPKQLEHSLCITDVYLALLRTGYEIVAFEVEKSLNYIENEKEKYIIPDIMISAKDGKGRFHQLMVEVCLDKKFEDIKKKYNIYQHQYIQFIRKTKHNAKPRDLIIVSPFKYHIDCGTVVNNSITDLEGLFKVLSI